METIIKGLERRTLDAVELIPVILKDRKEQIENHPEKFPEIEDPFVTVKELTEVMDISSKYGYEMLETLSRRGFLIKIKRGRMNNYEESSSFSKLMKTRIRNLDYSKLRKQALELLEQQSPGKFGTYLDTNEVCHPVSGEIIELFDLN